MKFSKFIIIPIMIAALAAIVQCIDQYLMGSALLPLGPSFGWITFQAWAVYFFAGCNIQGGIRAFAAYFTAMVASAAIIALGMWFDSLGLGFWAFPLSLLILVIPVICLERVKYFDMIPALFIGAGAFFALMTLATFDPGDSLCDQFIKSGTVELIYCTVGLIFGWITVTLRVKYEKSVAGNK